MILSLRKRHRNIFAVLGALLPIAFVVGIAVRRTAPSVATLPPELLPQTQTFTATEYEREDLFARSPVKVRLWEDVSTGQKAVGFVAPKDFVKPDLLAYWVAGQPAIAEELSPDAVLLGSFVATVLPLPSQATNSEGSLILFTLADQEIVEISKPFVAANMSARQTSRASLEVSRRLTSAATTHWP